MAAKHLLRESLDGMFDRLESLAPTEEDIRDRADLYRMAYLDCEKDRPFNDDALIGSREMARIMEFEIANIDDERIFPIIDKDFDGRLYYADQLSLDL